MIVGTAGHIDHGKTTLVRALTGVDTDRLPEEKRRGISIDLGYAFLDLPGADERIGFIDVPGHERLVHTMLAGATGIDFGLLLVAADDGVMPQTREHLAVLSLLGITRGAAVVTKVDRADPDRVQAVCAQTRALLEGTPLAEVPVLPVSAIDGAGVDALKTLLFEQARHHRPQDGSGQLFRMAIDRVFTLEGLGTVVTGTIRAGAVTVGDPLLLAPTMTEVRVRSLHAQNRAVQRACAGQRCAIALGGVARERISRGHWIVAPQAALSTDRIDAELAVWPGESTVLRSGAPVLVHLGTASLPGTVAVLDGPSVAPGASGRVQLVLRQPVGAWHSDRVVLRDVSATRTIAGGRVLDPFGPVRYRRTVQRQAELQAACAPDPSSRIEQLLAVSAQGVDLRRFAAAQGCPREMLQAGIERGGIAYGDWAIGQSQLAGARTTVLEGLSRFHQSHPDELGPDAARLRRLSLPRLPEPLWRGLLAGLQQDGELVVRGALVHRPDHGVRLSAADERIAQKAAPRLAAARFEGAWVRDLARDCAEPEPSMRTALARMAQRGDLHQVVRDLYYPSAVMAELAAIVRAVSDQHDAEVTAARFRDATGLGRKRAIQVLEYFDRIGLLRRVGDVHRLRTDTALFASSTA